MLIRFHCHNSDIVRKLDRDLESDMVLDEKEKLSLDFEKEIDLPQKYPLQYVFPLHLRKDFTDLRILKNFK